MGNVKITGSSFITYLFGRVKLLPKNFRENFETLIKTLKTSANPFAIKLLDRGRRNLPNLMAPQRGTEPDVHTTFNPTINSDSSNLAAVH